MLLSNSVPALNWHMLEHMPNRVRRLAMDSDFSDFSDLLLSAQSVGGDSDTRATTSTLKQ